MKKHPRCERLDARGGGGDEQTGLESKSKSTTIRLTSSSVAQICDWGEQ